MMAAWPLQEVERSNLAPEGLAMPQKKKHDPAAERGERNDTGKTIQRGGKSKGKVPGATEQKPKDVRKTGAEGNTLLDAVRSLKKVKR